MLLVDWRADSSVPVSADAGSGPITGRDDRAAARRGVRTIPRSSGTKFSGMGTQGVRYSIEAMTVH
ncbi:hypothetical protein [Pseudonocardia acidicola]|uniref:hypothetical protein n=1 Tax=Pseudonocardia acidicola TaxID=2724939 RepID=UPI001469F70B|nr:hypothetical protein [Pseudonocardia acidicola]